MTPTIPLFQPQPPHDGPVFYPDFAGARLETTMAATGGRFQQSWYRFFLAIANRLSALVGASIIQASQADLALLGLGPAQSGQLVWVTDFNHVLQWTGTAFQWGPGESGSAWRAQFDVPPTAPGWAPMDGSATNYLNQDGSTTAFVTPVAPGFWFRR